ncbi:MAG: hypothetical protein ACQEWM_11265 [Actinomycetota bacterium]
MTDASSGVAPDPDDWEELEPHHEWTRADRWRLAAWVLIFANLLGVLLLAPAGDGGLVEAAEAAGSDAGPARLVFWVTLLGATLVGNGIAAGAAATRQRWAIVPALLATLASWAGFFVAVAIV